MIMRWLDLCLILRVNFNFRNLIDKEISPILPILKKVRIARAKVVLLWQWKNGILIMNYHNCQITLSINLCQEEKSFKTKSSCMNRNLLKIIIEILLHNWSRNLLLRPGCPNLWSHFRRRLKLTWSLMLST